MVNYSSAQLYKDWRYSVQKDFTTSSGESVKYAPDGLRTWGNEKHKLAFPKAPHDAVVNCDGSLLAIAVEEDIHVFNTTDFSPLLVCKGHVSNVDSIAFQPGRPNILVSSAQGDRGYSSSEPIVPTILFWDLDEERSNPMMDVNTISKIASQATETVLKGLLEAQSNFEFSAIEQENVTTAISPIITRIVKTHKVASQKSLHGRLVASFQSEIFSPSGSHFIYLPGQSPRANGNAAWDIKVYSMTTNEDILTLSGHTDAIMWTGYSPDEKFIATVSWDQSIRIWNSTTGLQKSRFNTSNQNWTGGFSPDSKRFAATCGDGSLYVYSVVDGSILVEYKAHKNGSWMRALSWAPDSNTLAVGEGHGKAPGRFILFDVDKKEVTQERLLSTDKCPVPDEYKSFMGSFLECSHVHFVDSGKKVIVQTSGDGGIETYDLVNGVKWRFARPGVEPIDGEEIMSGEDQSSFGDISNPLVSGGYAMTVWEDLKKKKVWVASMDGDAVRIWDMPMAEKDVA